MIDEEVDEEIEDVLQTERVLEILGEREVEVSQKQSWDERSHENEEEGEPNLR